MSEIDIKIITLVTLVRFVLKWMNQCHLWYKSQMKNTQDAMFI